MLLHQEKEIKHFPQPSQASPLVTAKFEMAGLRIRVFFQLYKIVKQRSINAFKAIRLILQVKRKYESIFGEQFLAKASKVDGRYFWRLAAPGFPSEASLKMQTHETNRFFPNVPRSGLRSLIFSITNKCPLNCEHCFEWNNLNKEEKLSKEDLIKIVHDYQDYGTTQIMFSGGEPMLRVNDICEILLKARSGTDFWIITSGLGLNSSRAKKLKEAGLTGVMVSIDHFEQSKHDHFRGYQNSFNSAVDAVIYANHVGLVTTLSLCATKSFVNQENLINYMEFAKGLGVSFVQILEPRATGRYQDQDVGLGSKQLKMLKQIYLEYNSSVLFKDYPIINYLGYHQRKAGCFGAGDRFLYVDTEGDAHICPYCAEKIASARDVPAAEMIDALSREKCHAFNKNVVF